MQLKYHQATYDLLTQSRINPQKAVDRWDENEAYVYQERASRDKGKGEGTIRAEVEEQRRLELAWTRLDLYQRPVGFSDQNIQALDELEQKYGVQLPASVREWYSLDIAPDIMSAKTWGPFTIQEIMPMSVEFLRWTGQPREDLWHFLTDEYIDQGGEQIAFQINVGDDPPVFARHGDDFVQLASTFSEFIYLHFWDWHGHYTFEHGFWISHHPAISSLRTPEKYHVPLGHVRKHFTEQRGKPGLRFYDEHTRIWVEPNRVWENNAVVVVGEVLAGGMFRVDSVDHLSDLIMGIWGDDAPVFCMDTRGDEESEQVITQLQRDFLRRVLKQNSDWIKAPDLAYMLGANIPVLGGFIMRQLNWLIEQGEAETHPYNRDDARAEHRYRAKQ